jgi:hypothetical protein
MMQLQDPKQTKVLIVSLAETTPVLEAANLQTTCVVQASSRGRGSSTTAWRPHPHSPLLRQRARNELREIDAVATKHAQRYAIVPLLTEEPVGWNACGLWRTGKRHEPCCLTMGVFERYLTLWVALCILAGWFWAT